MKRILTLLMAFLGAIHFTSAQFFEDFKEGIPGSWTVLDLNGGDTWEVDQYGWGAGAGLRIRSDENINEDYLITPKFLINSGVSERISFHVRSPEMDFAFSVKLSVTGTSPSDFNVTLANETEPEAEFANYSMYEYDLSAFNGQMVHIAIIPNSSTEGTGLAQFELDDFTNDSFNCKSPFALEGSPRKLDEALFAWRNVIGQFDWVVQYGETGFSIGSGTSVPVNGPMGVGSVQIGGLTSGQSYDYYVQSNCGENSSYWSGPYTITQPLEGESVAFPIPIDLSQDGCGTTPTIAYDYNTAFPFYTFPGNTNVYNYFSCDAQATVEKVGLWTRFTSPSNGAIKITTNNVNDNFVIHSLNCNTQGICYRDEEVFCYRYPNNMDPQTVIYLEPNTPYSLAIWRSGFQLNPQPSEICVEPVNCVFPVDLGATVTSDTSAVISWQPYDGSQTMWEYVVQQKGQGTPIGGGTSTNQTSVTINGTQNETYELYVRTNCGNGVFSDWAGPFEWLQSTIPANNDCENAKVLEEQSAEDCEFFISGNTLGATYSPGNFDDCTFDNEDVWFKFITNATSYMFDISSTSSDFGNTNFTGTLYDSNLNCTSGEEYEPILCVYNYNDENYIAYNLTIGETYYFRVSLYRSSSRAGKDASFDLCVNVPPAPPANNNCMDATPIQKGNNYSGDTSWATNFDDVPLCDNRTDDDDKVVWYTYKGSGSQEDITISFCDRPFSVQLGVFVGSCDNLNCVYSFSENNLVAQQGCDSGWRVENTFTSDGNTTYYIGIRGFDEDEFGTYSFNVEGVSLSFQDRESKLFKVFPNPVENNIILENLNHVNLNDVEVVDINGRIIKHFDVQSAVAEKVVSLNDIQSGIYFLKVNFEGGFVIKRIVKQ